MSEMILKWTINHNSLFKQNSTELLNLIYFNFLFFEQPSLDSVMYILPSILEDISKLNIQGCSRKFCYKARQSVLEMHWSIFTKYTHMEVLYTGTFSLFLANPHLILNIQEYMWKQEDDPSSCRIW